MTYVMVFCFVLAIIVGYVLGAILALYVFKLGESQKNYRHRKKQSRYLKRAQKEESQYSPRSANKARTHSRNYHQDEDDNLVQSRIHHNDDLSWGAETYAYEGKDPKNYARQNQHIEDEAFQYAHRRHRQEERSH